MAERRIAVVTGGNRGIGFEVCRQLAARGLRVVVAARDEDSAQRAAAELDGDGVPFRLDVTDPEGPGRLAAFLESQLGRADVLVNNAGVFLDRSWGGLDVPMDAVRQTLEVNLLGAWALSQAMVPLMRRHGYGRIVNLSSGWGPCRRCPAAIPPTGSRSWRSTA